MLPFYKCPLCGGELVFRGKFFLCNQCKTTFPPDHGNIFLGTPHPKVKHQTHYWDTETDVLIPNRYDLMFYGGLGIFLILFIAILISQGNLIIYILMIFSLPITILAIYWDFKHSVRSTTGTLGNICAICWIILQFIITIALGLFVFSNNF